MAEERYYAKVYGQVIGIGLILCITLWYLKDKVKLTVKKKHLSYSLVFGLPIIVHLLSQNILSTFDQIIINQLVGNREAGLYSVAYKIGMVQIVISMGILKSWTPIFYRKLNEGSYSDINELAKKYAFIVSFVAVGLIFFSEELITLLVDDRYHEGLLIIPIVVISYFFFFLYTMYVNYAFYHKKTKNIALFTIIAGSVNIGLNYLLIPQFGYIAAAWTTLLSYMLLFALHYLNVTWFLGIKRTTKLSVFTIPLIITLGVGLIHYQLVVEDIEYWISLLTRIGSFVLIGYLVYRQIKS
jgi:O-antigen/teichoic acid export membrane protein